MRIKLYELRRQFTDPRALNESFYTEITSFSFDMHIISTELYISNAASLSILAVLAVPVLWIFLRLTWTSQRVAVPLPPGPTGHWLFGNNIPANEYVLILNLHGTKAEILDPSGSYRKFEEWTQAYGPIFSLRQGLQTVIVIGRYQVLYPYLRAVRTY